MRETTVSLPTISLMAGTRVMLGAGLGLLLGDRLKPERKKSAGWTLLLAGALTTFPLVLEVLRKSRAVGGKK